MLSMSSVGIHARERAANTWIPIERVRKQEALSSLERQIYRLLCFLRFDFDTYIVKASRDFYRNFYSATYSELSFDYSDLWCVSAHVIYFLSSIGVKFMFARFNKFTINAWFLWPATITRSITQFGGPLICFYLLIKPHSDSFGRSAKIAVNSHSARIFNANHPFPFSTRTQEICRWIESI